MVFGSRGLGMVEKEQGVAVDGLSEHVIGSITDFRAHIHHAFQIRKTLVKPDPKLKVKSHFVVVFGVFDGIRYIGQLGIVELAGSENASNDQSVIKANCLSSDEKKSIARSFNALSAVINHQPLWKESSLTLSLKNLIESKTVLILTLSSIPSLFKHTLASLKFTQRLRDNQSSRTQKVQLSLKEELQMIRSDLKEAKFVTGDWAETRENAIERIEELIKNNPGFVGTPAECQEFLIECQILRKQLQLLKTKPPLPIRSESARRRSASPVCEDIGTERDVFLNQKVLNLQTMNDSQIRKIEEMTGQIASRDQEIKLLHNKINDLERTVYEKDRTVQKLENKLVETASNLVPAEKEIIHELKQKLKNKTSALSEMEKQLMSRNNSYNEIKFKYDVESSAKKKFEDEYSQMRKKNLDLSDLEKQLLTSNNSLSELRFKYDVEVSSRKKYEEECSQLRKKVEELSQKAMALESKNMIIAQKLETTDNELNSAKQEIDSRKFKSHQLSASIKEMEGTMNLSAEEVRRMRYEMSQLRSENQMFRIEKDNLFQENCELRDENNMVKDELKALSSQLEDTNQYIREKESALQGLSSGDNCPPIVKKKKKKIKLLKDNINVLQQQLKDCQALAEEEIKRALEERDQALNEVEECKGSQIHELSIVESQVEIIEEQLMKLKDQNAKLTTRENELSRELRNAENGKEKYKDMVLELKEEIKILQDQLSEMDEFAKEYIDTHRKDIKDMKVTEEKALVLKSRIRAMHDVKNMIQAHRVQLNN